MSAPEKIARIRISLSDIEPEISQRYRRGDIRHCFADISTAREQLGYKPQVNLSNGMTELVGWLQSQGNERATKELQAVTA